MFSEDMAGLISPTFKEQAYDVIKKAILYRRLQVGEVYSQDAICNELKISRTPVREALLELQKEGYISFMRGRGVMVIPVTRKDAEDIIEMRYHIEQVGCRLAAQRRSGLQMAQMDRAMEEMDSLIQGAAGPLDRAQMYMLDREFHRRIFLAANNNWLLDEIEKLRDQFLRVESQDAFDDPERSRMVSREHHLVLEAIRAQDEEEAAKAMRYHLDCTSSRTLEQVMRTAAPTPAPIHPRVWRLDQQR